MAANNSRKAPPRALVAVLIVAAAVFLVVRLLPLLRGSDDAAGSVEQLISLDAKANALKTLPALNLARPTEGEQYSQGRNLFDYSKSPEILELERQRREAEKRAAEERRRQEEERAKLAAKQREEERLHPKPPVPPPPPPPPIPPAFGYSYVGYFGPMGRGEVLAVLIKRGGPSAKPTPVKVGDTLENSFIVKKIDFDAVTVGYVDSRFGDRTETVRLAVPPKAGR